MEFHTLIFPVGNKLLLRNIGSVQVARRAHIQNSVNEFLNPVDEVLLTYKKDQKHPRSPADKAHQDKQYGGGVG